MNSAQQKQEQSHLLLNLTMIGLETFYSFVFKHDDFAKKQAAIFFEKNAVIKVNCYIPYIDFYLVFSDKGILFNTEAPKTAIALEMSSTIFGYFQALVLGHQKSIRAIKIYANQTEKDQMRDLLLALSLPQLATDWKKWVTTAHPQKEFTASPVRVSGLLEKIDTQRLKIDNLYVENKQFKNRIRHLERKQKTVYWLFSLTILVLIAMLIYQYVN